MNNTDPYLALQFNIYLPEGISLRSGTKPYVSLPKDRFPYTEEFDEEENVTTTTFNHAVQFARHGEYTTFVISPNDLSYIKGNSGTILKIYVVDSTATPGLYPIKFKNVVFTKYENKKMVSVNPPDVSTFLVVGSPVIGTKADLTSLSGYIPADVCTATNTWLTARPDITELDVSNVDDAGKAITVPNKNALYYVKQGSAYADILSAVESANVVKGSNCERFVLTDDYPVNISKPFTAASVTYQRTIPAAGWHSLCLPFAADIPNGVTVEKFSTMDSGSNTIDFSSASVMEANMPYIFKAQETTLTFSASNAAIGTTPASIADNVFTGTYQTIGAGSIQGCYALRLDGTGFGIADGTAYVPPFRAYVCIASSAKSFTIIHDDDVTSINDVSSRNVNVSVYGNDVLVKNAATYSTVNVFGADGRWIKHLTLSPSECQHVNLPSGIYFFNKTKVLLK